MKPTVGIVGAGIIGRLAAWVLAKRGFAVTVFDQGWPNTGERCSAVAAGMLAPVCESPDAPREVTAMGREGLTWWCTWADALGRPDLVTQRGTLVVAPERSRGELTQFRRDLAAGGLKEATCDVKGDELKAFEADFDERFQDALFVPEEGHLEAIAVLGALHETSLALGVRWEFGTPVRKITSDGITTACGTFAFDWMIDARGWAAKPDIKTLLPVRGEVLTIASDELKLSRPVRVLHPRHAIYIVPRPDGRFVIGATNIPSDDESPVSVRSTLEFLSVAYHVFPAMAEARVVASATGVRPAFADHRPSILEEGRVLRINGAYRHGFMVGPALAEKVATHLAGGQACV